MDFCALRTRDEFSMKALCCGVDFIDDEIKIIPYRADLESHGSFGMNEKSISVSRNGGIVEFAVALRNAFALCENKRV
mgnify:CR=1 FL=1